MKNESVRFHIKLKDDWLAYETRELIRLFVKLEDVSVTVDTTMTTETPVDKPGLVCDSGTALPHHMCYLRMETDKGVWEKKVFLPEHWQTDTDDRKEGKRRYKNALFQLLQVWKPTELPWGILTGVRPVKLAHQLLLQMHDKNKVASFLETAYCLHKDKAQLVTEIALFQKPLLESISNNHISLYVGIPLCPSRCSYCSFISQALNGENDPLVEAYLQAMLIELKGALRWIKEKKWHVDSLYIGGGTPSVLSAKQIQILFNTLENLWPLDEINEITFEAGRPDTITREKLHVLQGYPIHRLSINPQTLQPDTLKAVNRCHTVESFFKAWHMATAMGFHTINLDLILGLPGEGEREVFGSLAGIAPLQPVNMTVHALAVKRSATLRMDHDTLALKDQEAQRMMKKIYDFAAAQGLQPYYLYRQKEMAGHLENVGFCQPGKEGRYNILMMEEKQTIMGIGAGAVSKLYFSETDRIQRKPNAKNIHVYIQRMLETGFDEKGWNEAYHHELHSTTTESEE